MRQKNFLFVAASIITASLPGLISVRAHGQTSPPASGSAAQAPEKPYDWKASFAKYPAGKVPRTRDGKPDLQGIWSRSVLTPLQPLSSQHKTASSEEEAREAEEIAHHTSIDLRV